MTGTLTSGKDDDARSSVMLDQYLEPLRPFLDDTTLNEVCVNRPREVWTENRSGWQCHQVDALTFGHCLQLAKVIAGYNNKSISMDKPVLSASLPSGDRVQVILPPACEPNTISITVRKPSRVDKTLDELDTEGAFAEYVELNHELLAFEVELLELKSARRIKEFLDLAVRMKRTILIVGRTGSGKTAVAKSLIRSIPIDERLITLEDVHELFLRLHKNRVHLFYGREGEGGAKVTPKQMLAACLRMRPSRILLAELRGDEAWEFVKNVGSGHPGSISTMHANGAFEAFEQLTALIKDSHTGMHLDTTFIKHRLFTTVDVVLYYDNLKLREIYYDPEFKRKQLG